MHNCHLQFKDEPIYAYICSRCGGCYACDHKSQWDGDKWMWRCIDGQLRPAILDTAWMQQHTRQVWLEAKSLTVQETVSK
jgi:hypothetical protein